MEIKTNQDKNNLNTTWITENQIINISFSIQKPNCSKKICFQGSPREHPETTKFKHTVGGLVTTL